MSVETCIRCSSARGRRRQRVFHGKKAETHFTVAQNQSRMPRAAARVQSHGRSQLRITRKQQHRYGWRQRASKRAGILHASSREKHGDEDVDDGEREPHVNRFASSYSCLTQDMSSSVSSCSATMSSDGGRDPGLGLLPSLLLPIKSRQDSSIEDSRLMRARLASLLPCNECVSWCVHLTLPEPRTRRLPVFRLWSEWCLLCLRRELGSVYFFPHPGL